MNWITRGNGSRVHDEDNHCEHLVVGDMSYATSRENDNLGEPEVSHYCQECHVASEEAAEEEITNCHDCHTAVPMKEVSEYKWFEFSYREGDEPLHICKTCHAAPKHQARIKRDNDDYDAEEEYYSRRRY